MRLQTASAHRTMRWANGAGMTHEIVAVPGPELWSWRLSLAEVDTDGPFSVLEGVDRALVVASGRGMTLRIDGVGHPLACFEAVVFAGEAAVAAELHDGPVRDLNLMVRRGGGFGAPVLRVERLAAGQDLPAGPWVAAVVLEGVLSLTTPVETFPFNPVRQRASRFDALISDTVDDAGAVDAGPAARVTAVRDAVVALATFAS